LKYNISLENSKSETIEIMAMGNLPISKTLKCYPQKYEDKESIERLHFSMPISKLMHTLYLEVGQSYPWVVPLGTSHLDFPRPIEL
jgi:hypothetical protein